VPLYEGKASQHDNLVGSAGDDTLDGKSGNDSLYGGAGNDRFIAGSGDDVLDGGDGIDTVAFQYSLLAYTSESADGVVKVYGGDSGNDTLVGIEYIEIFGQAMLLETVLADSPKNLWGTDANDSLVGGAGRDTLHGHGGSDTLQGQGGVDILMGGDGNDWLYGGAGDDLLLMDDGADVMEAGDGIDKVVASVTWGAEVDIGEGYAQKIGGTPFDRDYLSGFEDIDGSFEADILRGDAQSNVIAGLEGSDSIVGRAGDDFLWGGEGDDTLLGGAGRDELHGGEGTNWIEGNGGFDWAFVGDPYDSATISYIYQNDALAVTYGSRTNYFVDVERLYFFGTSSPALAFDMDAGGGSVARLIGAGMGPAFLQDPSVVGIGIRASDEGSTEAQLSQLLVGAVYGGATDQAFVAAVYANVFGWAPSDFEVAYYAGLLAPGAGFTRASLLQVAASTDLVATRIDLAGLANSGLAYDPGW
jgi:hypothetical protein